MRITRTLGCQLILLTAIVALTVPAAASGAERTETPIGQREEQPTRLTPSSPRGDRPLPDLDGPSSPTAQASARKRGPCAKKNRKSKKRRQKCQKRQKRRAARDFNVSAVRLSGVGRRKRVLLRLQVKNRRKWAATSVRACARVNRKIARIVAAPRRGAVRYKRRSVCWILRRIKPKKGIALKFTVKLRRRLPRLKVGARVSAGNSNPVSRRFKRPTRPHKRAGQRRRQGHHKRGRQRKRATASNTAPCLSPAKLGVVFVTDDSESMSWNDPSQLRARAISVGLDQLPDGSLAAATAFSDFSRGLFGASTVDAGSRSGLKSAAEELFSEGSTDYQEAFLAAQDALDNLGGADKKVAVFLSDGAPNTDEFTADAPIAASGTPIYTIGLGVDTSEQEEILVDIAAGSGAQYYPAGSAGELQSIFARIVSSLTCGAETFNETFSLNPGESRTIPFAVEPQDGEFRALASWSNGDVTVSAQRPNLTTMSPGSLLPDEGFVDVSTYALLTATNPMIGGWQLKISADEDNIDEVDVTIDVFKRYLPNPPPPPPAPGRRLDPCVASYPNTRTITTDQFGGEKKVYDRAASLYQVCAGFGAPEALDLTPGMKCALIGAAATFAPPAVSSGADLACETTAVVNAYRSGDWAGYAAGQACGYFSKVFAGAAGVVAAGASSPTGPGAAAIGYLTYRSLSAFLKVACGGLLDGGAAALGAKLEADHQTNIALDVTREGKCIAYGKRGFGKKLSSVHWSAVDCP